MHKKEDRRTTLTKRMLKDSLIEMLQEKDIYHISIPLLLFLLISYYIMENLYHYMSNNDKIL